MKNYNFCRLFRHKNTKSSEKLSEFVGYSIIVVPSDYILQRSRKILENPSFLFKFISGRDFF